MLYSPLMYAALDLHIYRAILFLSPDVETTGSSSEFYEKFSIRYHISLILKSMWESPVHQEAIIKESRYATSN